MDRTFRLWWLLACGWAALLVAPLGCSSLGGPLAHRDAGLAPPLASAPRMPDAHEESPKFLPVALQTAFVSDEPVKELPPQGYLMPGPAFSAHGDPQSPRGLAEQLLQLKQGNEQLEREVGKLKGQMAEMQQDVQETREAATRSEQAWEATKRDLATTRSQLEARQRQIQQVLERLQADQQTQLQELDGVVELMQTALRKYQESQHDGKSSP